MKVKILIYFFISLFFLVSYFLFNFRIHNKEEAIEKMEIVGPLRGKIANTVKPGYEIIKKNEELLESKIPFKKNKNKMRDNNADIHSDNVHAVEKKSHELLFPDQGRNEVYQAQSARTSLSRMMEDTGLSEREIIESSVEFILDEKGTSGQKVSYNWIKKIVKIRGKNFSFEEILFEVNDIHEKRKFKQLRELSRKP